MRRATIIAQVFGRLLAVVLLVAGATTASAQQAKTDSLVAVMDSMYNALPADTALLAADTLGQQAAEQLLSQLPRLRKAGRDWSNWKPNPQRALWLALVIPGGGQIYNRKYWKLPLVYGGFVGCAYAMSWNNMMYKDYAQAYLDIMDDDPGTQSYNQFLHLGRQITPQNEERYKTIFKKRKDRFRRYRDLSFFVMVGVYALSVIDAYVDAELSEFDISKDLSLRVEPAVMGSAAPLAGDGNQFRSASVGLQCSLNF